MGIKTNDSAFEIKKAWKEKQAEADALKAEMMKEQYQSEIDNFAAALLSNKKVMDTFGGISKKERSIFFKSIIANFDTVFALSEGERNKYKASQEKRKNNVKNTQPKVNTTAAPQVQPSAPEPAPQVQQVVNPVMPNVMQTPNQNVSPNTFSGVSQ